MIRKGKAVLRYGLLSLSADDVDWVLQGREAAGPGGLGISTWKDRTGCLRIGIEAGGRGLFRPGGRGSYQCRSTKVTMGLARMGFGDGRYAVRRIGRRKGGCERTLSLRRTE